jgi:protein O-mannosyl-transferase
LHYRRALEICPGDAGLLNNLAWIRAANAEARFRDGPEAVRLAERACQVTEYKQPMVMGTLAAAYAEAGRFDEAMATAEKARDLAASLGQKKVADRNQELFQLYKAHKPFHESR